jgi:hypothetical protein
MPSLVQQHRALVGALAWWYVRRRLRSRAESIVAVPGDVLRSGSPPQRGGAWWKWLLAVTLVGGVGWLAWRRLSGGGDDDWGDVEPTAPEPPATETPEPSGDSVRAPEPAVPAGA